MANPSAAQALTTALGFNAGKATPEPATTEFDTQSPPDKLAPVQSASCLCQSPLVERVSLASGEKAFTYDSLPWTIGASCPVNSALVVGSPLEALTRHGTGGPPEPFPVPAAKKGCGACASNGVITLT